MRDRSATLFLCYGIAATCAVNAFAPAGYPHDGVHPSFAGQTVVSDLRVKLPQHLPVASANLDFENTALLPNTVSPVKWSSTGEPVSPHSYRLGLDPKVTESLLEYCQSTGITKAFRSLLVDGNPLSPNGSRNIPLQGFDWHVQRPESQWNSNAHWISPCDKRTHHEYLKVLSRGGFDEALQSIGKRFGFEGLAVYHLSFIGVSSCTKGYMHCDFEEVEGKGFNLIIPLILAEDTEPELDIEQFGNGIKVGRYKYVRNEANMVGDLVGHATSACDYLDQGEMRMAATVYIADINAGNAARLASYITQQYPPRFDSRHLLSQAGSHWKLNDPTKRLPVTSLG